MNRLLSLALVAAGLGLTLILLWQMLPARPVADPNVPPASSEEAAAPLGTPPKAPAGHGGYTFNITDPKTGAPVSYDPCRPLHYVVNPAGAPRAGVQMVRDAVGEVSSATGLRFVYDGVTTEAPTANRVAYQPAVYGARWAPVVIGWATPAELPLLTGDTIGLGGSSSVVDSQARTAYVTGSVWLDRDQMKKEIIRYGKSAGMGLILHELGHVVGLGHVQDKKQLMYPRAQAGVTDYAAGDRRGLARLGSGPCLAGL